MAGGGIRRGMTYGEADDLSHRVVADRVTPNDFHATLLHLFELDHRKLVFEHSCQTLVITAGLALCGGFCSERFAQRN
jgi:hypothetical protein